MPLWKIYHPAGAFTDAEKSEIAKQITDIYGAIMPRFYVGVIFQAIAPENFYVGGKPAHGFVRIVMEHIARSFPSIESSRRFIDRINALLKPYIEDRGLDWELHIDETPIDYWSINGHYPPRANSEDEKRWRIENRPSPRTHD